MFTQCSNTVFLTSRHGSCHGAPFGTERWQDCLKEASAFAFEPMGPWGGLALCEMSGHVSYGQNG